MIGAVTLWLIAGVVAFVCLSAYVYLMILFWPELSGKVKWGTRRYKDEGEPEKKRKSRPQYFEI